MLVLEHELLNALLTPTAGYQTMAATGLQLCVRCIAWVSLLLNYQQESATAFATATAAAAA
eukprot:18867-Heterococcus_DN1.PRE.4